MDAFRVFLMMSDIWLVRIWSHYLLSDLIELLNHYLSKFKLCDNLYVPWSSMSELSTLISPYRHSSRAARETTRRMRPIHTSSTPQLANR